MSLAESAQTITGHTVIISDSHSLHECADAQQFAERFELTTGQSARQIAARVLKPDAPHAVFLTGSVPLGIATRASDVDFVVVVDGRDSLLVRDTTRSANSNTHLEFANAADPLRAGMSMSVINGITVETLLVLAPGIADTFKRLRSRGPELSDSEIMTLGRLSSGWLLWQSAGYLRNRSIEVADSALNIYCATKHFTYALIHRQKAIRALDLGDIPQALHLARLSVEMSYLAHFAAEGLPYVGSKWLGLIGHGRGAADRSARHPLLLEGVPLLFPSLTDNATQAGAQLRKVAVFLMSMRKLIETRTLFKISFSACPQIYNIDSAQ